MTTPLRYVEKFTSSDGSTISHTFSIDDYEWESEESYRVAEAEGVGADFAHDFAGGSPWAKARGVETVRFTIWGDTADGADDAWDEMAGKLRRIGRGKLWTLGADSSRRWCWAKLMGRPTQGETVASMYNIPVEVQFARYSPWYASSATTGTQAVTVNPTDFTVTNAGNAPVLNPVFRLRASAAAGFTNPTLTNLTNGYSVASTRDSSSVNSELKIDADAGQVLWSDDDGSTYANDYALATLGATQVGLMRLEPGDNTIRYAGVTPNVSVEWSFYAAWE